MNGDLSQHIAKAVVRPVPFDEHAFVKCYVPGGLQQRLEAFALQMIEDRLAHQIQQRGHQVDLADWSPYAAG